MKINLGFENLHADGSLDSKWDRLLKVVGDFEISVDGRCLFFEEEFPLIEFWLQLVRWLEQVGREQLEAGFEYSSMESNREPLVWFRPGAAGWKVGGVDPAYREPRECDLMELVEASRRFVRDLDRAVRERFRFELSEFRHQF